MWRSSLQSRPSRAQCCQLSQPLGRPSTPGSLPCLRWGAELLGGMLSRAAHRLLLPRRLRQGWPQGRARRGVLACSALGSCFAGWLKAPHHAVLCFATLQEAMRLRWAIAAREEAEASLRGTLSMLSRVQQVRALSC